MNNPRIFVNHHSIEQIEQMRARFYQELQLEPNQFESEDVQNVLTDNYWIERYLSNHSGDQDLAICNLFESLRWRKEIRLKHLNATDFPAEFFQLGALFAYEQDRQGHLTLHFRLKFIRRVKDLRPVSEMFSAFLIHQLDQISNGRGWTLVADFADCGLHNADLDLLRHFIWLLKTHFPSSLARVLVVDLPWVLRAFCTLLARCVPANDRHLLQITNRRQLINFIEPENLPEYLGGTCSRPYFGLQLAPSDCLTMEQYARQKLRLNDTAVSKLMEAYGPCLDELKSLTSREQMSNTCTLASVNETQSATTVST